MPNLGIGAMKGTTRLIEAGRPFKKERPYSAVPLTGDGRP